MSWWWPFERDSGPVLYGYSLSHWHFLGTAELAYLTSGEDQEPHLKANIAFFLKKTDGQRAFKLIGVGAMPSYRVKQLRNHPFHVRAAEPWAAGEHSVYWPVSEPSEYLNQYMRETYDSRWDREQRQWLPIEKPQQAEAKPASRLRKRIESRDNITVIDFTKKEK